MRLFSVCQCITLSYRWLDIKKLINVCVQRPNYSELYNSNHNFFGQNTLINKVLLYMHATTYVFTITSNCLIVLNEVTFSIVLFPEE